jgi:hypothetical protein
MDYDVGNMLENLFGGTRPTIIVTTAQPAAVPEAVKLPTPAVDPEAANLETLPDFDSLPLPGEPCPVCGSLEEWTDMLDRRRCGNCERDTLDKATRLAERTAWLRQQAQRQKPAPRIAPGCVAAGRVDTQDIDSKRPAQSQLWGRAGR